VLDVEAQMETVEGVVPHTMLINAVIRPSDRLVVQPDGVQESASGAVTAIPASVVHAGNRPVIGRLDVRCPLDDLDRAPASVRRARTRP